MNLGSVGSRLHYFSYIVERRNCDVTDDEDSQVARYLIGCSDVIGREKVFFYAL